MRPLGLRGFPLRRVATSALLVLALLAPVGASLPIPDVKKLLQPEAPSFPPFCVVDPDEPHHLLVYARPYDEPDSFAQTAPKLRASVVDANTILREDTARIGWRFDLRVLCDAEGDLIVREVVVPTSAREDTNLTVFRDVRATEGIPARAKLLVQYAGYVRENVTGGAESTGRLHDDRPGPENVNNAGGSVGVVYGTQAYSGRIVLHEAFHGMGAVQTTAPHSDGRGHCWGAGDLMCVAPVDGAPSQSCERFTIDCGRDDYFAPEPEPGSYLATRWNVARSSYLEAARLEEGTALPLPAP